MHTNIHYKTSENLRTRMQREVDSRLSFFSPSALKDLYINYRIPIIKWLVKNYSVEVSLATELAQSAFAIFVEKSANGSLPEFKTETNIKSYLFAIAKNKFRERSRQQAKTTTLSDQHLKIVATDTTVIDAEKQEQIQLASKAFKKLGEKCQQLLQLAIVFKQSMQEIAEQLQYENTNTAKTQKYKCLIRLRKLYHQSPA